MRFAFASLLSSSTKITACSPDAQYASANNASNREFKLGDGYSASFVQSVVKSQVTGDDDLVLELNDASEHDVKSPGSLIS